MTDPRCAEPVAVEALVAWWLAESPDAAAGAVEALMKRVGAAMTLSAAGVDRNSVMARIAEIIGGTMSDLNCGSNPRPVNDPNAVAAFVQAAI